MPKVIHSHVTRCAGCGKLGVLFCPHCLEIYRATRARVRKLREEIEKVESTLGWFFAMRGKFRW